jgi:hypothetical protein
MNHTLLMDMSQTFNHLPKQPPYSLFILTQTTVNCSPTMDYSVQL